MVVNEIIVKIDLGWRYSAVKRTQFIWQFLPHVARSALVAWAAKGIRVGGKPIEIA